MLTKNQRIETPERLPNFIKSGKTPKIGVLINPLSGGNLNGLEAIRRLINDYPRVIQRDVQIEMLRSEVQRQRADLAAYVHKYGEL